MLSINSFSIIFFSRKSRSDSSLLNIYCRITINSRRAEISLKRSIPVNNWDNSKGKARGNTTKIKILNNYLDVVYDKLLHCHKQLLSEDKVITARHLGFDVEGFNRIP